MQVAAYAAARVASIGFEQVQAGFLQAYPVLILYNPLYIPAGPNMRRLWDT